MAKVTFHQLFNAIRGGIGGLVFRERPDGMFIISGAPSYNRRKSSAKQKEHRERFKEATRYARWAQHHHPIYAELAAGPGASSWKSAYNYALSDWFEAPVIHAIEPGPDCIRVRATDNIMVARVQVSLLDEAGKVIDHDEATRSDGDWWSYPTQIHAAAIRVRAWDLADNVTVQILSMS